MQVVSAQSIFESKGVPVILDVRTPSEFMAGRIPGAQNLPLFSDEERAIVGTTYKQVNPEQAFLEGLEFAGQKMRWYVEEALRLAPDKKVIVHCWRGGKRSKSLAWLLSNAGFNCQLLEGGYKEYRRYCREELVKRLNRFVLLGGKTGVGKSDLLVILKQNAEQVLDLEGLAHHKGSAFGTLGEEPQPTCEQFENDLYQALSDLDPARRVWVESESQSIGKVFIPDGVFSALRNSPMILIDRDETHRVDRLVKQYGQFGSEALKASFDRISKRLGGQHVTAAQEAIETGDLSAACRIALRYYDKAYDKSTKKNGFSVAHDVNGNEMGDTQLVNKIIAIADQNGL